MTAAVAGAAGYVAQERRDRARVEADPAWEELRRPLGGDEVRVGASAGEELVVDLFGPEEAPVVVLVHGWTCTAKFWTRQIEALGKDHRVIAYDKRGHGRSAREARCDYSIEALADDLEAVIDGLVPAERRFVLCGHSLGAMTIVAWAARHAASAKRCAAAALINTGIGELVAEAKVAPMGARVAWVQAALGAGFLTAPGRIPGGPLGRRAVKHVALGQGASAGEVEFCMEMIRGCAAGARAGCGETLPGLDLWWSLEALGAPTAVVVGERDRLTPPGHGREIAKRLPCGLGVVELPGAGHMGPVEANGRVTEVIRGLVRSYAMAPEPVAAGG